MKFYGRGTLHMLLMHYNGWSLSNSTMYPRSLGTPKVPWDLRMTSCLTIKQIGLWSFKYNYTKWCSHD